MNPSDIPTWSIAQSAEIEIWQSIRDETRRRLRRILTLGSLYAIAALLVGIYLLSKVREIASTLVLLENWEPQSLETGSVVPITYAYVGLALFLMFSYPILWWFIGGKIYAPLSRVLISIPWMGGTMRTIILGDFFASIYQSIAHGQTYKTALENASADIRDTAMRDWIERSAHLVDGGHSITATLRTSPIVDQPLTATAALLETSLPHDDVVTVWHQAAHECHLLAQSRLSRTSQVMTGAFFLLSAFVALFALMTSFTFMSLMLSGLS